MRLWHQDLIPKLDGQRLCDLHMTCCNLRGNGWKLAERNPMVSWIVPHGEDALVAYHWRVLSEMHDRGYQFDVHWQNPEYCGKNREPRTCNVKVFLDRIVLGYAEMDDAYLQRDLDDLHARGWKEGGS